MRNAAIALRELLLEVGPEGDEALIWWLFGTDGLEDAFGEAVHQELVGTNFVEPAEMEAFRRKLQAWVDTLTPTECLCYLLEERRVHGYFDTQLYLAKMERVARKSPWLELWTCRLCDDSWFVLQCNNDGDYEIERALPKDVAEALEQDIWAPRFTEDWDGSDLSVVDGPDLEEWLRDKGYESLEAWRTRNGPELEPDRRVRLASLNNRDDILMSSRCVCWACSAQFKPSQIRSWSYGPDNSGIRSKLTTAVCPECGRKAVLGDAGPLSFDEPFLAHFGKAKPKSSRRGLEAAIEWLYEAFEGYSVTDISSLSLYQCEPSPRQLAVLAQYPLRELPDEAVWSMWFYGSIVREAELKHFLPRILEVLSERIDRLMSSSRTYALFSEQLHGVLGSRDWPAEEREALRSWALEVVDFNLHRRWDLSVLPQFVVLMLEMGISAEVLVGGLSDPEAALAWNVTHNGQELLRLDRSVFSKDEAVLQEFEKVREGILQWQLEIDPSETVRDRANELEANKARARDQRGTTRVHREDEVGPDAEPSRLPDTSARTTSEGKVWDQYWSVWKKAKQFTGRADRREYWTFALINAGLFVIPPFILGLISETLSSVVMIPISLFLLAAIVPSIAVAVRRLHDRNLSGWVLLIALIPVLGSLALLVVFLLPGTPEENRFGRPGNDLSNR